MRFFNFPFNLPPLRRVAVVATILVSICSLCCPFPADVTPINDTNYFKTVYSLISKAEKSVYVIMYHAIYYDKYSDSFSNKLLKSLIAAKKRGLEVGIILDRMKDAEAKKGKFSDNERMAKTLSAEGIKVYMDDKNVTTHSKLLIIDSRYVIVGSTNWTYEALSKNNETNALIDSEKVAEEYINYFNQLVSFCAPAK